MKTKAILLYSCTMLMILATAAFLIWLKTHQRLGAPGLRTELPDKVLDYIGEELETSEFERSALPKDTTFKRRLYTAVRNGQTNQIQMGFVLMGTDRTSIHKPELCLPGQGWAITGRERTQVAIPKPFPYLLPVMKLTSEKQILAADKTTVQRLRALYVYWFVADKAVTAEHWQRMWWMAKHLLRGGGLQRWGYISCFTVCLPGQEEATFEKVQQFMAAALPEFQLATGKPVSITNDVAVITP